MNHSYMNRMADVIERTLTDLRSPCRVVAGGLLPGWIQFDLQPLGHTRFDAVSRLRNDLAMKLGTPVVRIGRKIGYITIQIPNGMAVIRVDDLLRDERVSAQPAMAIPLGIGEQGEPVVLRIGNTTSNVLISGIMGSGKTTLAHSMLIGLCARNRHSALRLILCDPKHHELDWMMSYIGRNLESVHQEREEISSAIAGVANQVEQARAYTRETILFIDELVWSLGTDAGNLDCLKLILKRGREFGFRVIACEPVPGTAPLAGDLLASFHVRITGRQSDAASAYNATGVSNSGAESLNGQGDMLIVHFGQAVRFRAVAPPASFQGQKIAELPAPTVMEMVAAPLDPGAQEDIAVMERLTINGTLGVPGVTSWANERFKGQWDRPYAGNRVPWMKVRYELARGEYENRLANAANPANSANAPLSGVPTPVGERG